MTSSPRDAFRPTASLLLTDLYQLNMMQVYFDRGMFDTAVFEFFVRELPPNRGFLVNAGLEQAVAFLETAAFADEELQWMKKDGWFSSEFVDYLADFRFTGDVDAVAEGRVVFPDEPVLRITAPLPEAQLLETRLINLMQLPMVIASKAARMILAAPGKPMLEFGLRRAHGAEAALLGARAAYIAGFAGTSVVLTAPLFNMPIGGTMAHSFIQSHDDETEAFLSFARARPDSVTLLLDTYDTVAAAKKVVGIAPTLKAEGIEIRAVRLDSGDLTALSRAVRAILDEGGLSHVQIVASGGLDEYKLQKITASAAPIDSYGIGTSLSTSADAPALNCVYKLQEIGGRAKRKYSEGKATWPGRKQIYRRYDDKGVMAGDLLTLEGAQAEGEPLMTPIMRGGEALRGLPGLDAARARAAEDLARLPAHLKALEREPAYPVTVSEELRALATEADAAARDLTS